MSHGRSWIGFLLMSIVIPVGLFTGLKFAGIGQPLTPEAIALTPVYWQFNRTHISNFVQIDKFLNATYTDGTCEMHFSVYLGTYALPDRPPGTLPFSLQVVPSFSATPLSKDFAVVEVIFSFGKDINPSLIDLGGGVTIVYDNLSLKSFSSGQSAYVQFVGNCSSAGVDCLFLAWWYLSMSSDVTFSREIACSVTYHNGTAYNRVVQPFDLALLGS